MEKKEQHSYIAVHSKDHDPEMGGQEFIGIVMASSEPGRWYNTGLVVRESTPEKAFSEALKLARAEGWDY